MTKTSERIVNATNENPKSNPWRSMTNKPLKWTLLVIAAVAPLTIVLLWNQFQPYMPWEKGQDASAPEGGDDVHVELIEPGMAPRRKLRFTPKAGDKQTIIITIATSMIMTDNGNAMPTEAMPTQKVTLDTTVKDINAQGDITFDFIFTNIEVVDDPENPSADFQQIINPLIGATGSQTVTNRGVTLSAAFHIPPKADPQLKKAFDGLKDAMQRTCSPLPGEAVGLGAKWKITEDRISNGMTLVQTSTHEITKLEPDRFTMKIHISQTAAAQELPDPSLPEGTSVSLQTLQSEGEGTTTIETQSMLHVESEVTLDSKSVMSIATWGRKQQFDVHTTMRMSVEGKRK